MRVVRERPDCRSAMLPPSQTRGGRRWSDLGDCHDSRFASARRQHFGHRPPGRARSQDRAPIPGAHGTPNSRTVSKINLRFDNRRDVELTF